MANENITKVIKILDPQAGRLEETVIEPKPLNQDYGDFFKDETGRRMTLHEAGMVSTSEFPALLKDGLQTILFDAYNAQPQTWNLWCQEMPSNRQVETYLEGSHIGLVPAVGEGDPIPHIDLQLDRTFTITNTKKALILGVTREMIQFDKTGLIQQATQDLGRAFGMTLDQDAYNVLTTAGNYNRNSTTGDNDIGANTAATTFGGLGMETILSTLRTMKDPKSGRYYGVVPDTLICGPRLEYAAKQLLLADSLVRQGGNTTNDVYGTGEGNFFRGFIKNIIVSPFIQSYAFVVLENKRAVVKQTVWDLELLTSTAIADNATYLNYQQIEYAVSSMYGFGMKNDRFAYYSSSSTAPIAN